MNLEDYKRLHEAMEVPSQGTGSPFRDLLEKMFDEIVRLERESTRGVSYDHRVGDSVSYTNSYKQNGISRPSGTLNGLVSSELSPVDTPLYPSTFKRGQRSSEALLNAAAECYIEGVSTRDIGKIFDQFGIESMSSTQVSNTSKKLDEGFEPWRNRYLGEFPYLILNVGYEKLRLTGIVRDVAVLTAVGIDRQGHRRILGVSVDVKEAELHWREFLECLVRRGLSGVEYIVSDAHPGLKAARKAVFTGSRWQRCQQDLMEDGVKQATNEKIRKCLATELRTVYNAETEEQAKDVLETLVAKYSSESTTLAKWLDKNIPDGLTVYSLPPHHRIKMRTSNLMKRILNQQIKQQTRQLRIFPNTSSLLRVVTSVIVEIDDDWIGKNRRHISWNA